MTIFTSSSSSRFASLAARMLTAGALAGGTLAACSSSPASHPAPVARADLEGAFVHALCDSIPPCCAQTGIPYDATHCQTAAHTLYAISFHARDAYDADVAGECLSLVRARASACNDGTASDALRLEDTCAAVFSGTVAPGGACATSDDCASAADGAGLCLSGTCALESFTATEGDACNVRVDGSVPYRVSDCFLADPPLQCDPATRKCAARKAPPAPCAGDQCTDGSTCLAGVCTALAIGSACEPLSDACPSGSFCDPTGRCAAQKKPGEPCSATGECMGGTCDARRCTAGSYATRAICGGSTG